MIAVLRVYAEYRYERILCELEDAPVASPIESPFRTVIDRLEKLRLADRPFHPPVERILLMDIEHLESENDLAPARGELPHETKHPLLARVEGMVVAEIDDVAAGRLLDHAIRGHDRFEIPEFRMKFSDIAGLVGLVDAEDLALETGDGPAVRPDFLLDRFRYGHGTSVGGGPRG